MSSFTEPLKMKKLDSGFYRTTREFKYYLNDPGQEEILIPNDYTMDCASIPKILHRWFPPDHPKWAQAAVLHDWLYEHRGFVGWGDLSRKQCDKAFLNGMKILGASWFKRWMFYTAVRSFGWIAFKNRWKEGIKSRILISDRKDLIGEEALISKIFLWNYKSKSVILKVDNGITILMSIVNLEVTF